MKKKVLALSIAAMIGGAANAGVSLVGVTTATTPNGAGATDLHATQPLQVNADGVGHILLTPYFSTNNGNSTLISLVNTDSVRGKAVKVRFRGAANSDDIFDFSLFMSPGDVWTANVAQGADGKSMLTTTDKSCTLPFSVNQSFLTDRLSATTDVAGTREGYIEVFNMADIVDHSNTADLYTRIKHVSGVAPCLSGASTTLLNNLQADPADATFAEHSDNLLNFRAPSTGLMGGWTIINVAGASVAWSGNMTAIEARTNAGAAALGRIVFSPQTSTAAINVNNLTSDPLLRSANVTGDAGGTTVFPVLTAAMFDLPDLSTPYTGNAALVATGAGSPIAQANQVSAALAVKSVKNEYLTDTTLAAATDWTFSMPTRRYGVASNYAITSANKRVYTTGNSYFDSTNTRVNGTLVCVTNGGASNITPYDREENTVSGGFVISPGTAASLEFCGETSVLGFNSTTVLGAGATAKNIDATYRDGWLNVATPGLANIGLPILGAAFVKASGPAVSGKSTNFGMTNGHRFTR